MSKKNKKSKSKAEGVPRGNTYSKKEFRLKATTYFLTYKGQNQQDQKITKLELKNYLVDNNPFDRTALPKKYAICQQKYESGQIHFHVILFYEKRKQILNPNYYDYKGIHPNIQHMRNLKAALQYIKKQDPQPLANLDIHQTLL